MMADRLPDHRFGDWAFDGPRHAPEPWDVRQATAELLDVVDAWDMVAAYLRQGTFADLCDELYAYLAAELDQAFRRDPHPQNLRCYELRRAMRVLGALRRWYEEGSR